VNKEASHYVRLFGGNKIGNLIFLLPLVHYVELFRYSSCDYVVFTSTEGPRRRTENDRFITSDNLGLKGLKVANVLLNIC
jgi:hypothetical protein